MADIIPVYNQKRMDLKDNPRGVLDYTLKEGMWSQPDLELLASHIANCVSNGIYQQRETIYPIIDMESMVQLKREKRIAPPKGALQAAYILLDDYASQDRPPKYRFTPYQAAAFIQAAIDLDLAKEFDISYVERVIKKAETERYSSLLEGRRAISSIVDKRVAIERAKRIK